MRGARRTSAMLDRSLPETPTVEGAPHRPDTATLAAAFAQVVEAALARAAEAGDEPAFRRLPGPAPSFDLTASGRAIEDVVRELLQDVLPDGMRTDHPRFFAFVPSPTSPISWVGEFAMSVHNLHAGSARQSGAASAIERSLIARFAAEAGLPEGAGGLFVSGGSMANLAALVAARDRMTSEAERPFATAYVSEQTHVSVAKALRVIGVPDGRIRVVATDDDFRLDMAALRAAVEADRAAGLKPFAVIASAGTTNTGAIDPLDAIADLCAAERLWMHVDGAYGASLLLCRERRRLLRGIGRADSISWDAHKWLFQTYGCGMLLVRDAGALADSFRTGQPYLRDGAGGTEPDFWDLGPELTRPARAVRLWLTLRAMGLDAVGEAIGHGFRMAEAAEAAVRSRAGWTVVSPARLAIVAFRYAPDGMDDETADAVNLAAAARMMDDGFAVVGTTRLRGRAALRICAINPQTTAADMDETVRRLHDYVREGRDRLRTAAPVSRPKSRDPEPPTI